MGRTLLGPLRPFNAGQSHASDRMLRKTLGWPHLIALAGFVEFARRDSPPDQRKRARLRRHAAELGMSFDDPRREWFGCRPTLPDYLPAIGRSAHAPVAYAFGHQHLGLTLAATTGQAMAALISGDKPPFDLDSFDLRRFA